MPKRRINPAKQIRNEFRKRIRCARTEGGDAHSNKADSVSDMHAQGDVLNESNCSHHAMEDCGESAGEYFDNAKDANNDKLLYNNAQFTTKEACRLLLRTFITHKLSDNASNAILKCIHEILPSHNTCPKTRAGLISEAMDTSNSNKRKLFEIFSICATCGYEYDDGSCCLNSIQSQIAVFDVRSQCDAIIKDYVHVMQQHAHSQHNEKEMTDIPSSLTYRKEIGFNENITRLTFTLFADGGQTSNSTNLQIWPLMGTIAELPPILRYAQHNAVWFAIWLSAVKPRWDIIMDFLSPKISFASELLCLSSMENAILYQVAFLYVTADLPARAGILNMQQHNSIYACSTCYVKGRRNVESNSMIFLPQNAAARTKEQHSNDVLVAKNSTEPYKGIKGESDFQKLLNIPEAAQIDYMHTILHGVLVDDMKKIFHGFRSQNIIIGPATREIVNTIDENIKSIVWPSEFKRRLRPIQQMSLYKAMEYKICLIYGIPLLFQPMHAQLSLEMQYENLLLLSAGVCLLLQNSINDAVVHLSQRILSLWFNKRRHCYGQGAHTLKAHQVTHLPDQVKNNGPLWTSSCFFGESCVGFLNSLVTRPTAGVLLKQMCTRLEQRMLNRDALRPKCELPPQETAFVEVQPNSACEQYLRMHLPDVHAPFKGPRRVNINNCRIIPKYSRYTENVADSFVLFRKDETLEPAQVLYFLKIGETVHALVNQLIIHHNIGDDFAWVEEQQIRRILQDPRIFTHFIAIDEVDANWIPGIIRADEIERKMILMKCKQQFYLAPLFAYEHN